MKVKDKGQTGSNGRDSGVVHVSVDDLVGCPSPTPDRRSRHPERQHNCVTVFAVETENQGQVTAERLIVRQLDHDFR